MEASLISTDALINLALLVFLIAVDLVVILVVAWFVYTMIGDATYAIGKFLKKRKAKKDRSKWQA